MYFKNDFDYHWPPCETNDKIKIIRKLHETCENILKEVNDFNQLSDEYRKISGQICSKKQEILDFSSQIFGPYDDNAQKALFDLQHKNQELNHLNEDLQKSNKKCYEKRHKIDCFKWELGREIHDLYHYLRYHDGFHILPIFNDNNKQ